MDIRNAVKSIIKPHEEDRLTPLTTIWGEQLSSDNILSEYPRPQLQRDSYMNLNGWWSYAFTSGQRSSPTLHDASTSSDAIPTGSGDILTGSDDIPTVFDGNILVPFSPEAPLSGVNRQLKPDEYLWYKKVLPVKKATANASSRLILHFGAVDYFCEVYMNHQLVLSHLGGYLPFQIDITDHITDDENILILKVQDTTEQNSQARGKQSLHRGGIFYTAQSGIWQTVWMEWVPVNHIENLWFETDYDKQEITAHITAIAGQDIPALSLCVKSEDKTIMKQAFSLSSSTFSSPQSDMLQKLSASLSFTLPESKLHSWSPETPFLYDVELSYGADRVSSYFAYRLFSIEKPNGIPVFCLNHKPYFLMGVLDQGYWPDGLYTAPSDEALLYDISTMKALGFNMLRKHIKVEAARWYYHCDRLGMIVCQDMINGGGQYHMPVISYLPTVLPRLSSHMKDSHSALLSRKDAAAKKQWEAEALETVDYLNFFPSIAIWVVFNEGWGQYDTARITDLIHKQDPSRLIDSASGWFDQNCGDFVSEHNYFRPLGVTVRKWAERAFFLSEYGGYACHIKEHSSVNRVFGYKQFDSLEDFEKASRALITDSLLPLQSQGLSGAVYTQLSDVEEEVNGILTYDRKLCKFTKPL